MNSKTAISRRSFLGTTAAVGGAVLANSLPGLQNMSGIATAATPADRWQIGCYTRPWGGHHYLVALDAIAEAGYKYCGLMTHKGKTWTVLSLESTVEEAAKVGDEAKKRGLTIVSTYCGGVEMVKRDTAVAGLRHLVDLAVAAGAASILLTGPNSREECDTYYGSVADACDYALTKNVAFSVKPHDPLVMDSPELRKTVEKVGRKNFRVYYDPGNIFFYSDGKLNPLNDVSGVDGLVSGLVVKDFSSKVSKDDSVWLTPGTGEVDFPGVFAKLKKGGFTSGPLLVETLGHGDLPNLLAQAKQTRVFLEKLVR